VHAHRHDFISQQVGNTRSWSIDKMLLLAIAMIYCHCLLSCSTINQRTSIAGAERKQRYAIQSFDIFNISHRHQGHIECNASASQ
jgi:hypothetical protein